MGMAKIYWDRENYPMVEKVFRQSAEFCSEHDVWKLNVAHVFFMQVRCLAVSLSPRTHPVSPPLPHQPSTVGTGVARSHSDRHHLSCLPFAPLSLPCGQESKFLESIRYYEPIVKKHSDNILEVTAIVLANLCVAYIMTSKNEEAEELMRRIEREEERVRVPPIAAHPTC